MFGEQTFYYSQMRKMTTIFGTLFNDIHISRFDAAGKEIDRTRVPLAFSPKDKLLARDDQDPTIQRPYALKLPRMGFEFNGMKYDGDRKGNSVNRLTLVNTDKTIMKSIFEPTPWNFHFNLYVAVKNIEDGLKILEQIVPWFTPDWSVKLDLIPEMNIIHDVPIILNSVQLDDKYEGDPTKRQSIIYTLSFTMKSYIYGPIKEIPVIKEIDINFRLPDEDNLYDAVGKTPIGEYIQIQAAMLANGSPTSNAALSVPLSQISANSDYGISSIVISNDEINKKVN